MEGGDSGERSRTSPGESDEGLSREGWEPIEQMGAESSDHERAKILPNGPLVVGTRNDLIPIIQGWHVLKQDVPQGVLNHGSIKPTS